MFENLTEKLSRTFKKLRGYGRLNDKIIDEALREVKLSLLEADVNFKVVRDFTSRVAERSRGHEVMDSLTPAQQVIKIVRDELIGVMGREAVPLAGAEKTPVVIMMVGLQGSGKTTTVGKLARYLGLQSKKCLLAACDIHRPAAANQLLTIGDLIGSEVVAPESSEDLPALAKRALEKARSIKADYVIFDTAGRLHIDQEMMDEISALGRLVKPSEILLVADAMTGQDAVNVAEGFTKELDLSGVVLTKFDGDARGGAALSIRQVVGVPIKFIGVGEKMEALEVFHPDRLAARILGMGDVLTLIEKAEQAVDKEQAINLQKKIRKNQFTLDDFRDNLKMIRKMGSMEEILSMIPGLGTAVGQKGLKVDERSMKKVEAIICSMTPGERFNYKIITLNRRRRIARGSGTELADVNRLIKQFEHMQKMMKKFNKMGKMSGAMKMGRSLLPFQ